MYENEKLAVVIGAGDESIYAIKTAQKRGFKVYAFDGDKNAKGLSYADKSFVVDIRNCNNIIKALKDERPIIVLPVPIGRWLLSSGKINDYYNLKGVSADACEKSVDKFEFHRLLSAKDLRNCQCYLINSENIEFPKKYPVILKPRYGSGSRDVFVINNKQDFLTIIKSLKPIVEDFVCETFFNGQEYGVDGAVLGNQLYITLIRKKEITPFPYRQCTGYYALSKDENILLYNRTNNYLKKIIQQIGINNALFHADVIDNGMESFVVELSPRPSGHNLHNLFTKFATSVDMLDQYISYVGGQSTKVSFIPQKVKHTLISYFNFEKCKIKKVPSKEYLQQKYPLIDYNCNISNGDYMNVIKNGKILMERGYYILQADNDLLLNVYRNELLNEFEVLHE